MHSIYSSTLIYRFGYNPPSFCYIYSEIASRTCISSHVVDMQPVHWYGLYKTSILRSAQYRQMSHSPYYVHTLLCAKWISNCAIKISVVCIIWVYDVKGICYVGTAREHSMIFRNSAGGHCLNTAELCIYCCTATSYGVSIISIIEGIGCVIIASYIVSV